MGTELNRRQAVAAFGTIGLGALVAACGGDDDGASTGVPDTGGATTAMQPRRATSGELAEMFDDSASCRLSTELTEGPYYFDTDAIRSDIREDREGTPLRMGIRVRDADSCKPLPNAIVDVWHCDALGVYSGFESASTGGGPGGGRTDDERYLRGAQVTNRDGIAEFETIYPGWYQGRAVHIHAKIHLDRQTVLTTQLFFDDEVSAAVNRRRPYSSRGEMDVSNATDAIFDDSLVLKTRREGAGYAGVITFDVERA